MTVKHFVIGRVPKDFVDRVLGIVKELLETVGKVEYVEVYFYGSAYEKMAFLEDEALDLGVIVVGDYVAMHEAWRGWPRIHIDYERCSRLPEEQLRAVVAHEVAHVILHGSPLYYVISFGPGLPADLDPEEAVKLVYIASTVVKDLDVYELLVGIGLEEAVRGYASFLVDQVAGSGCKDRAELLGLTKALVPCLFISRCDVVERLSTECKALAEELVKLLKKFKATRSGDLSADAALLVNMVLSIGFVKG